jgi:type IV secretory pathway VirD2 relaxase
VVVKASYFQHRDKGHTKLSKHLAYLAREGVSKDGTKGLFYTGAPSPLSLPEARALAREWAIDERHFRLIISPENGAALNLRAYTAEVVTELERELGTRLQWLAAEHHNTDQSHVHLVLRGVDERGKALRLERSFIKSRVRELAERVATRNLGLVPQRQVALRREANVRAMRFTYLDRYLLRDADASLEISFGRPDIGSRTGGKSLRTLTQERLAFLSELGLAERRGTARWRLNAELESTLVGLGRRVEDGKNLFRVLGQRALGRSAQLLTDDALAKLPGKVLIGTVLYRGPYRDLSDRTELIVESDFGNLYRVALGTFSESPHGLSRVGDYVAISPPGGNSADLVLARLAAGARSRGKLTVSRRDVESYALNRGNLGTLPYGATPSTYTERILTRLSSLRELGVVQEVRSEEWAIPDNLVTAAREARRRSGREQYRHLSVTKGTALSLEEQVKAAGYTWLDQLLTKLSHESEREAIVRPDGALGLALRQRAHELTQRGISLDSLGTAKSPLSRSSDGANLGVQRLILDGLRDFAVRSSGNRRSTYIPPNQAPFRGQVSRVEHIAGLPYHRVEGRDRTHTYLPAWGWFQSIERGSHLEVRLSERFHIRASEVQRDRE